MAVATRRTAVANGKRRNRGVPRGASLKQKLHFGSRAQRAAAARSLSRKRTAKKRRPAVRHTKAQRRHSPRVAKRNVAEIVSFVLPAGNPGAKGSAMAKATKKHSKAPRKRAAAVHHAARHNAGRKMVQRTKQYHRGGRRGRRNPGGGGVGDLAYTSIFIILGAVGSKLATQAVLQAKNTGLIGYAGNAAATFLLSFVASKFMRNPAAARAIAAGGAVQIVLRLISDYTPLGQYTAQLGLGDYQASNFVTPQRYVDALNGSMVELPPGWAPTTVVQPAPAHAGVAGLYDSRGTSLYG